MNQALPEIEESAETLKERLRQETRSRQKQRLLALYLLKSGQAKRRTQVGQLLGVSRRTVGEWLERYATEGLEGLLLIRTHTNRAYSLTPDQEAELKRKLSDPAGFASYGAIRKWINETTGLSLTYFTARRIARDRLGAKLKVARKSHTKKPASG